MMLARTPKGRAVDSVRESQGAFRSVAGVSAPCRTSTVRERPRPRLRVSRLVVLTSDQAAALSQLGTKFRKKIAQARSRNLLSELCSLRS